MVGHLIGAAHFFNAQDARIYKHLRLIKRPWWSCAARHCTCCFGTTLFSWQRYFCNQYNKTRWKQVAPELLVV